MLWDRSKTAAARASEALHRTDGLARFSKRFGDHSQNLFLALAPRTVLVRLTANAARLDFFIRIV
jgi:hypothetical protein